MESSSRGRLTAGIPSSFAHPLPEPVAGSPADAENDQGAAILPSDTADPLKRGPLLPRPGVAEEGK